ncbi:MAG: hypothetical protein M0D57_00025 [Sphingobacteriales bacterium JAD_PAG50586_3]|nr:MAG: hypothetical protein M0D57_00025 [Sphingobacteriales bacterium JAD_PAG50586_3]
MSTYLDKQKPHHLEIFAVLRDIILDTAIGFEERHDKYLPVFHYCKPAAF